MRSALLLLALLMTGCYDSSFGDAAASNTPQPPTTTIAHLRELHTGTTFAVTGDVVVEGRVTSCDCERNFYRSLCIENNGAGLEIRAGLDQLHNDYPEGAHVTLRLKGLCIGISYGTLQVGLAPTPGDGYVTGSITSKPALDQHLTRNGTTLQPLLPPVKTISELSPDLCGTLIRIEELHGQSDELVEATWGGYHRFSDDEGNAIYTFVRTYADFADHEVPLGRCSLTGILQYDATGEGRYFLKLRHESDCAY